MAPDLLVYTEAVDAAMQALLSAPFPEVEPLYGAMRYHLGWADSQFRPIQASSGKRMRPLFCLLACQAVGGHWKDALPLATGLELIHNFSLIHDDIEDASPLRRHRPTVWAQWGVPQAINTGDAMLTLARLAVHDLTKSDASAGVILAVMRRLEETSLALCHGQYLDMAFEAQAEVALGSYMRMVEGKTAALLACATETGALVGAGLDGPHASLRRFGLELGLAFQIVDDILDIWGDPQVTGKPGANDIRSRKKTLPLLLALETLAAHGQPQLAGILAKPALSEADVQAAIGWLETAGARRHSEDMAVRHTERALAALDEAVPPSEASECLRKLGLQLVTRDR